MKRLVATVSLSIAVLLVAAQLVLLSPHLVSVQVQHEAHPTLSNETLSYLEGDTRIPSTFNEREASHMADVRNVFVIAGVLGLVFFFIAGITSRNLTLTVQDTCGVVTVFLITQAVLATTQFTAWFNAAHTVFFEAGTWVFPRGSVLLQMYPEQFFVETGALYACYVATLLIATCLVAYSLRDY